MIRIKNFPLRYSIPLGILLFNLLLLTVNFYSSRQNLTSETIRRTSEQIRETGLLLGTQVESSLRNKNLAEARKSVNQISGFKNITHVLLVDENQNIIAANDFRLEGRNLLRVSDSIFPGIIRPQLKDSNVKIDYDASNLILYSYNQIFIGTTEGNFLPDLTGQLILTKDLTEELYILQHEIWSKAKINFVLYLAFSFFLWLIFNFLFLKRIVAIVKGFDNPTRLNKSLFDGRDEISDLANGFLKIHNQLKETLTRYQTILNATSVAIAEVNVKGEYLFVNKTWQNLFGYTSDEAIGKQTSLILHPNEKNTSLYQQVLSGEILHYTQERKYQHKNGNEIWCDLYVSDNLDEDGSLRSVVGIMHDITEKKQAQKEIEEQDNKFKLLFDRMNLGVTYQNDKGEITDVNPAAKTILSASSEQLQGKMSSDLNLKAIQEDGSEYQKNKHPSILALKTGKPILNQIMGIFHAKNNEYRWIKIDAIPQFKEGKNEPHQVFTTFNDITDIKNVEFLLKENEQRYMKAQQLGKVGNWEYNVQTEFLWGSDETLRIFGFDPKVNYLATDFVGACIPKRDIIRQALIDFIEKGIKFDIEYEITTKNEGKRRIVHSKAELIRDQQGNIIKVIGVLQDITDRKKAEIQLKESEEKFYKIYKNSPNAIILTKANNYETVDANNATIKITGYTLKELNDMKTSGRTLFESKDARKKYIDKVIKNGSVTNYEANFITKSGERRIWLASGETIQINNERYILGIIEDVTEIRKAQYELNKQAEFTFAMTENQPAGIVACNAEGKLVLFNKAAKEWHGIDVLRIPQEEWAENYGLYKVGSKTVLKTHEIPLIQAFNGKKIKNLEMIIKSKGQKPRIVTCNGTPFFDSNGFKIGAVMVMTDISHQKLIEDNLKRNKSEIKNALIEVERSEFLLNESGKIAKIGAWEFNLASRKTRWSDQVFDVYALPIGNVPTLEEITAYFIEGSKEVLENAVEECITLKKRYELELRFQNANNEKLWVNAIGYPVTNKAGEVTSLRGIIQDITEQKQTREEIEKTEELYRLLANNANDLVCLQEPDSTFKYISPSIKNLLGYEPSDFLGRQVFNIVHKDDIDDLQTAMNKKIFSNAMSDAYSFRVRHKEGYFVWLEFLSTPVYKDNEINYFVTSARDISQWVLAKEEIQKYQRSLQELTTEITMIEEKQKKEIASNIHDHLSQSLVISNMRINELKKNPTLKLIQEDLKFIESHITDALENSRKITYELSPPVLYQLGIIEALHWLLEEVENTHKIKCQLNNNNNISHIKLSDEASILLYRSIQEVITNAIKHAKASLITLDFEKNEFGVNIFIIDNGLGFEASALDHLKNHSGSGFGLFTVKERIRNIRGEFTISSEINKGTTIKIFVPLP
ncbi:PAS domain S-box protein [Polaribacter sp. IC073]|uniref:PAS domain-containing sensor histidine kinase n=1 Tax=Polaribacter sp. IC073 TaxID=2508540 RepID=UPI0011BFA5B0|nr:PAS domain S-box protein [Polaribacter sp. IC073]TXD45813.1 PAS domain S-box protein [Polaribacter sp. IC073]